MPIIDCYNFMPYALNKYPIIVVGIKFELFHWALEEIYDLMCGALLYLDNTNLHNCAYIDIFTSLISKDCIDKKRLFMDLDYKVNNRLKNLVPNCYIIDIVAEFLI